MMNLTFNRLTQVGNSGPQGPLVFVFFLFFFLFIYLFFFWGGGGGGVKRYVGSSKTSSARAAY